MSLQLLMLVMASISVGTIAVISILRIESEGGVALRAAVESREACEIGFHIARAQLALRIPALGEADAKREIEAALLKLDSHERWLDQTEVTRIAIRSHLENAAKGQAANENLSDATGELANLLSVVRVAVTERELSIVHSRKTAIVSVSIACGLLATIGVILAVRLYRSVMRPISSLTAGLRKFAAGELSRRIETHGDREFVELARDFNSMASQLETLCTDLTRQVEIKSRELTRSERLASVGYLAAGVAHEINNPLGIIAGYGERSLQQIRRGGNDREVLERWLGIVCDEAFRCKAITDRLLNLARPSANGSRRKVSSIAGIARDVIDNLAGLPIDSRAQVRLVHASDDSFRALVCEEEIKQVLLNLLLNALAASRERGQIDVALSHGDGTICIIVADDGAGMNQDTLGQIFEPFFSHGESRGTGLGLSITHAIVAAHGGSIRAVSDGIGRGSRFTVTLPATRGAYNGEVNHAIA